MNACSSRGLSSWFVACLAGTLFALATAALADTRQFGPRSLDIPAPQDFKPLAAVSPRYMQAAQAYLPATNRLVEAYASAPDAQALGEGKATALARYFQLQAPRNADGVPVSEQEFVGASKEIESGLEQTLKDSKELTTQLTEQGNAAVKRMTTTDPKIALSGVHYLGAYRREPWGLFFSIKSGVSAADGTSQVLVCGGALVLVNYQLLFLYSYSQYHDESDRQWVEQATSSWADAVRAANPNDAAVGAKASHGFSGGGMMRNTVLGAIIGGLVGLVASVLRKRKQ